MFWSMIRNCTLLQPPNSVQKHLNLEGLGNKINEPMVCQQCDHDIIQPYAIT